MKDTALAQGRSVLLPLAQLMFFDNVLISEAQEKASSIEQYSQKYATINMFPPVSNIARIFLEIRRASLLYHIRVCGEFNNLPRQSFTSDLLGHNAFRPSCTLCIRKLQT